MKKSGLYKKCLVCKKEIYERPSDNKGRGRSYCSKQCHYKNALGKCSRKTINGKVNLACSQCGNVFSRFPCQLKRLKRSVVFCSHECYSKNSLGICFNKKSFFKKGHPFGKRIEKGQSLSKKTQFTTGHIPWSKKWGEEHKKIRSALRSRVLSTIKGTRYHKSCVELLGCDLFFYKEYLESMFLSGMSWENHGVYGWHIDHIIPLNSFDLTIKEQQLLAFNYKNTRPLWAKDNYSKGCKLLTQPASQVMGLVALGLEVVIQQS